MLYAKFGRPYAKETTRVSFYKIDIILLRVSKLVAYVTCIALLIDKGRHPIHVIS